jgi:hypothetical protein
VDEIGGRIVGGASWSSLEGRAPQLSERHIGEPDVDRLPLQVQAACGDALAVVTQHLVGGGRSVAGNHLKRPGRVG